MANIYTHQQLSLSELLKRSSENATILIPDLQRPYIWTPDQVVLLVDSLIRGWPFGTLLMWKIANDQQSKLPARTLWETVDRVDGSEEKANSKAGLPTEFKMILDGQQRTQSLLLAFGPEASGFKLTDEQWHDALNSRKRKGRRPKIDHWSKGTLTLDLEMFSREFKRLGDDTSAASLDYTKCLKWVITEPRNGRNDDKRPSNYDFPIPNTTEEPGRYLRLSRLWDLVGENANDSEKVFRKKLKEKLPGWGVATPDSDLVENIAELLTVLKEVKNSNVYFLELKAFSEDSHSLEEYNEAVVNIFTRLNTAGRTLTTQQITYAWLKNGWKQTETAGKTAEQCIEKLRKELKAENLVVNPEETIELLSFIWSSLFKDGELLQAKDHLKGEIISPMAAEVSTHWSVISHSIIEVAKVLQGKSLRFRENYHSLSSFGVLVAQWFILEDKFKEIRGSLKESEREAYKKNIGVALERHADEWIFITQWADLWGISGNFKADCAKKLHAQRASLVQLQSYPQNDIKLFEDHFSQLLTDEHRQGAEKTISSLQVGKRTQVRAYYQYLWLWHYLDTDRAAASHIVFRDKTSRRQTVPEVDHITPFSFWSGLIKDENDADKKDGLTKLANNLGNCFLLEKNFNISKGGRPLSDFLDKAPDSMFDGMSKTEFTEKLLLTGPLVECKAGDLDEIRDAIKDREKKVKDDLIKFVRGDISRKV